MRNTIPPLVLMMACTGNTEKVDGNGAPEIQSLVITGTDFGTSDTLTCTVQYSDPDGDVVTESYEWTNQRGDIIGTANTIALQLGAVEPTEMINCMVTLNDGTVSVSEIVSTTIENTNPTVDNVSIEPNDGITPESTLLCSATASDVDGGEPTLSYAWERNGQPLASTPSLSLPVLGDAAMGDTFVCTATALDEHGGEGSNSNSVTVGNSPPSIESVELVVANNPDLPFTSQLDIECVANNVTDPNDDTVTLTYQWSINGSVQNSVAGPILSSPFSVDDEIGCAVTPNDGFDDGEVVESSVVIPNTLPEIFSVEIDPSTDVEADNTLVCTVDAFDADDGVLVGQYEWLDGDGNSSGVGNTLALNPVQNRPNDEITCIARVSDNDGANTEFQSSVWIINTDPVVSNPASISATPSPTSAGVLTCAAGFSDLNDGTLTPTYTWTLSDGSALSGNGSTYTINPAENNPTDTIVCTASAVDGDGSSIETSTTVVIENTPPSIDSLSIAPGNAVEANVTLEMLHSISDIDAEALTVEYDWIDDSGASLGTGQTLVLDNSRPVGSTITASLLVTDSYGATDSTTEIIDILNTLPVNDLPASISANPSPVTTGVLTCMASFSDYNDGSLTPSYTWTLLDGTQLPSVGNTLTIDANTTDPTDEIFCTATASDDDGESISSSTSIVVQNTAPSIDSFNITPGNTVEANVTLEMVLTVSDVDNDTLSIQYSWLNNQGQSVGTGSSLTLDNSYAVGTTLTAVATLSDEYGASDVATQTVTIENTLPQISTPAVISANPSAITGGTLTCNATFTDFNEGSISPTYAWKKGGVTIGSGNTYTIDANDASPTDTIQCHATATDGSGDSVSSVATIVVQNTNPTVNTVSISPSTAYDDSTITCGYSASDVDSNESQTPSYAWTRNGSNVAGTSSTYAGSLTVGDTIGCSVTVVDNYGGSNSSSALQTISNRAPTILSIALPTNINSQTDVTVIVVALEDDNQSLTITYDWYKKDASNGNVVTSIGSNSATLPASQFDKHDIIYVVATVSDGIASVTGTSGNRQIINTLPTAPTVSVSPSTTSTFVGSDLTCAVTTPSSDLDGDTITYHFEWFNPSGGLESDTYTTSTTDIYLGNNVDQLGTWTCQVTPADDDGDGPSAAASTNALGLETCLDYSNAGNTVDGVYTLYINGTEINAYCDMNTDGGGWTLFAITSNTQCAENLPFGSNELTSVSGSAYLTTLFKDFSHTEFLQDFRANGVSTTFDIIYGFSNSKTVSQRFNDSVSSGENVDWIVHYNNSTYNYSGNWMFSSTANTASKWSTSGSGFSNDDGIWGAQNGSLNGNSPGPYLGNAGWGHQNRDGSDSICGTYYYNGTSSTSASIKNLMFFR